MRVLLQALFASLLEWLGVQAERGRRATDAKEDRGGQERIGRRIEEHLRARRNTAADTYGGSGLPKDGARERGQSDPNGS